MASAMEFIFRKFSRLAPAALVVKAILAAVVADVLLLGFILVRRAYRKRYFRRRDARTFELGRDWQQIISGAIPFASWRNKPFDRRIVQSMALDALEAAGVEDSARLLTFLRASGLLEKCIFDARHHSGWRRRRALVALGRTRAPEAIPALSEALRDRDAETRKAALRGLGRIAAPKAGEEILQWVAESGLGAPDLALQNALISCCAESPRLLLPYLHNAEGPVREVLGRVLGEVASASLAPDLLPFVDDKQAELRAAAARALSHAPARFAIESLEQLARDPVWFVRLRAIVSLGKLRNPNAIPILVKGLTDSNRLIRLRAAEALVIFDKQLLDIFIQVLSVQDRYGLHALLTALENANLTALLEAEIRFDKMVSEEERSRLLHVLERGPLPEAIDWNPAEIAEAKTGR